MGTIFDALHDRRTVFGVAYHFLVEKPGLRMTNKLAWHKGFIEDLFGDCATNEVAPFSAADDRCSWPDHTSVGVGDQRVEQRVDCKFACNNDP